MIQFTASMIERIIQYISPAEVLEGRARSRSLSSERLKRICFAVEENMSEASIEKKLWYFANWVEEELVESGRCSDVRRNREIQMDHHHAVPEECDWAVSFYDMIECFVMKVLVVRKEEATYRYKFLESWHALSSRVGSDLFAACAYAYADSMEGIERHSFQWDVILDHDNYSLRNILDKGISDNHYHLRASVPYFDMSWLSLMNSVSQLEVFKHLDSMENESRNIRKQYATDSSKEKYSILHLKAVLIRIYLYSVLTDQMVLLDDYMVSPEWLLKYIVETECPDEYLGQIRYTQGIFDGDVMDSVDSCIEKWLTESQTDWMPRLKKACPGFYWFFWETFPGIPIGVLWDKEVLAARENIEAVCSYIEEHCGKLPLQQCSWLFDNGDFTIYRREWKKQTRKALYRLLEDPYKLVAARRHIQSVLNGFHINSAARYKDYMMQEAVNENQPEEAVFSGERWLLYTMFRNRYFSVRQELDREEELYDLFFAYLLMKEQFRVELLYNNKKVGFQNFEAYQGRKTWFTTCFSEDELAKIAVRSAFHNSALRSQELRITPCDTDIDNIRTIQKYDRAICNDWKDAPSAGGTDNPTDFYYYVFHFAKRKDFSRCDELNPRHRHEEFCRKLKRQTEAILLMRERNRETGRRLRGVDACASEDGCRPEVFATAFRVLKNHSVERRSFEEKMPPLRLSYHVGEDNQDVLDGIRAIDEAIYFLNMGSGDRLGHATMLGVDAAKWYYDRGYLVSIRQQDYLDNVIWLYQCMIRLKLPNVDNLLEYLEKQYQIYFERVYRTALNREYSDMETRDFDIHNYYTAWELRGDDPKLYRTGQYQRDLRQSGIWADYSINSKVEKSKRHMDKAAVLYHAYHYSPRVREEGSRSIVVKIPLHMVKGIQMVQRKLMERIAKEGIFIETNPSSNVLIAGLGSYGNHPIVNFYNKGLTDNKEELDRCSQISASINTDDLGVFVTSLKNEYALMAKALESMRDIEGNRIYKKDMVYDWIDRVRKKGNEQSFIWDKRKVADGYV